MSVATLGGQSQLNIHAPKVRNVIACIAADDAAGTTLTDDSFGHGTRKGDVAITDSGGASGDGWGGVGYNFATGSEKGRFTAAGATDVLLEEFTIIITIDDLGSNATVRPVFSSSEATDVALAEGHGMILLQCTTTDIMRMSVRDEIAGLTRQADFTGYTRSSLHTFVIRGGGPVGCRIAMDGAAPNTLTNDPINYKGPLRTAALTQWALGINKGGALGLYTLKSFVVLDKQLSDEEVAEVFDDPFIYHREPPGKALELSAANTRADSTPYLKGDIVIFSRADAAVPGPFLYTDYLYECITPGTSHSSAPTDADIECQEIQEGGGSLLVWRAVVPSLFAVWAGGPAFCPTETTAVFQVCTSHWLQTASVYARVKVATSIATLDSATPVTSAQVTLKDTVITLTQTGLTAGTFYYFRLEFSVDNVNWFPFPMGNGSFRAQRDEADTTALSVPTYFDCHTNAGTGGLRPSDMGDGADIIFARTAATNAVWATRARYAASQTARHIYESTPGDFLIIGGDNFMFDTDGEVSTADISSKMMCCGRGFMCGHIRMLKRQACYFVLGNHDAECGYHQSSVSGTKAMQKQAWNARIRHFRNPINTTYPEGGEAGNTSAEWVAAGAPAALIGPTTTPLQNFWAMRWGHTTFVFLDYTRYTDVGDTDDSTYRDAPSDFQLGATQAAFLQSVLGASTATHKVVVSHAMLGGVSIGQTDGTGIYSRASGVSLNSSEPYLSGGYAEGSSEISMHSLFRTYGVTLYLFGHNHKYAIVEVNGVFYVTCPTAGAASHTQLNWQGWNVNNTDGTDWLEFRNEYGTAESLGALNNAGAAMSSRMRKHYNVVGHVTLAIGDQIVSTCYQCVCNTAGTDASDPNQYLTQYDNGLERGHAERWQSNVSIVPASGLVDLSSGDALNTSPTPWHVYNLPLNSEITGTWWNDPLTNRYAANAPTAWQADPHVYAVGDYVIPTAARRTGYLYRVSAITTGVSGAAEPTITGTVATDWPTTIGQTISQVTVTFMCVQKYCSKYRFDETHPNGSVYSNNTNAQQPVYVPRAVHSLALTVKAAEGTAGGGRPRGRRQAAFFRQ